MTGYERPSQKGTSPSKTTYWADLWRPMPKNSHGESLISPVFATERDLVSWLRTHRHDYEEINVFRRKNGHDQRIYTDEKVELPDDLKADPERLAAIVADIKRLAAGAEYPY